MNAQLQYQLVSLHGIVEPDVVGFWPPAPGWWLIGLLALAMMLMMSVWIWRRLPHTRWRLLKQIKQIQSDAELSESARVQASLREMKRAWTELNSDSSVAALSASDWVHFLNSKSVKGQLPEPPNPYHPQCDSNQAKIYFQALKPWIRSSRCFG